MKKRISSLLAVMALALFLCVPALAAGFDEAELYFVTDEAGLLSEQEWSDLEARAEEISLKYKCGVYIIAVDNFANYADGNDVVEAAKNLYREYSLGYGGERSGVPLHQRFPGNRGAEPRCHRLRSEAGGGGFKDHSLHKPGKRNPETA